MAAVGQPDVIKVEGLKELSRALKRMEGNVQDLTAVNRDAAGLVASRAMSRAPVRSGRLKKSIRAGASKSRGYVAAGRKLVPYAGPIHFGWHRRHIVPNPFIYEALDERHDEVVAKYEKEIGDLVRRVGRETP
jgi:hypothetical protein